MNRIWPYIAAAAFLWVAATPTSARATPDTLDDIVDEMRGINQQLRFARDRLDASLAVTGDAPLQIVNQAQIHAFGGDHPAAAALLLDLTARPGFDRHPAYPEALEWLGESLWAMGLERASVEALRDALDSERQSPSDWRRRFSRYLARARDREPLDRLRSYWQRAQALPPSEDVSTEDGSLAYHYGRALFRGGALAEAETAFASVPADATDALRARYFLGVAALKQGEIVRAAEAFEAAREAWATRAAELPGAIPIPFDEIGPDGPRRTVQRLTPDGDLVERDDDAAREADQAEAVEALEADDETAHVRRMGAVIHLALARLAAARDDDAAAWAWYRKVPPGDPDHPQALSEATFVLFRLGRYDWCVRLVDQLLAERGDDMSAAQLGLWRAQLLARSTRYDDARLDYEKIEAAMNRRLGELDAELGADDRLFPPAALAWTAPDDARRARRIEAELVLQGQAIEEIRAIVDTLSGLAASTEALPIVRDGNALHDTLAERINAVTARVGAIPEALQPTATAESGGGDTVTPTRVRASLQRLQGRLALFKNSLDRYATTYRRRLDRMAKAEIPEVERLSRAVSIEQQTARRLAGDLRTTARRNIETFAGEALFGQVDLAWWRKEEVSRRMREVTDARDDANQALDNPRIDGGLIEDDGQPVTTDAGVP